MKRLSLILLVVICLFVPLNVMAETNHHDVAVLTYDDMGNLRSTGTYRSFNKNASVLGYGVKYK